MESLIAQAQELQINLRAARDRYLSFSRLAVERRAAFLAASDDTDAAAKHRQLRKAEFKTAAARARMEACEAEARTLYRQWLHALQPGDDVLTHSDDGWIKVKVKRVRAASIYLANGQSFSNLTGHAWRGHTALRMPQLDLPFHAPAIHPGGDGVGQSGA
jgi:hypothetical protein